MEIRLQLERSESIPRHGWRPTRLSGWLGPICYGWWQAQALALCTPAQAPVLAAASSSWSESVRSCQDLVPSAVGPSLSSTSRSLSVLRLSASCSSEEVEEPAAAVLISLSQAAVRSGKLLALIAKALLGSGGAHNFLSDRQSRWLQTALQCSQDLD